MSPRAILVAIAIAAVPGVAAADPPWASGHSQVGQNRDSCASRRADEAVGYTCHAMSRWSPGLSGWVDVGTGWLHLSDDTLTESRGTSRHVTGGIEAGGFARIGVELLSGMYFVSEADFAGAGAASLDASPAAVMQEAAATAHVLYGKLDAGLGQHVHFGGVTLGLEVAPGMRLWSYNLPGASPTDIKPALDVRVRAERWLGPWATAGVQASADVVDSHDTSIALYLGFHLNGYDGR